MTDIAKLQAEIIELILPEDGSSLTRTAIETAVIRTFNEIDYRGYEVRMKSDDR